MGYKFSLSILVAFLLASCGQFVGFSSDSNLNTGDLPVFELYLSQDNLQILRNSLVSSKFASLQFNDQRLVPLEQNEGRIRIRGNSSRYRLKKSYTLETLEGNQAIRYAFDAGADTWFQYNLAMEIYNYVGIHSPVFSPVGLFINGSYEGYYNIAELYNTDLNDYYSDSQGQLFKVDFEFPSDNGDVHSESEKKFPNDNDFSVFDRLLVNAKNMSTQDWVAWIETPGIADFEGIANYMVVRDFWGIRDVDLVNHYYYFYKNGFTVLPWDSDAGFSYSGIGGNTQILRRMLESEEFKSIYKAKLELHFLSAPASELTRTLSYSMEYLDNLFALLNEAAGIEPISDYQSYLDEYKYIKTFIETRPADIIAENPDWDFNN